MPVLCGDHAAGHADPGDGVQSGRMPGVRPDWYVRNADLPLPGAPGAAVWGGPASGAGGILRLRGPLYQKALSGGADQGGGLTLPKMKR